MLLGYKDVAMALEQRRDALYQAEMERRYRTALRQEAQRERVFSSASGMTCFVVVPWQLRQS